MLVFFRIVNRLFMFYLYNVYWGVCECFYFFCVLVRDIEEEREGLRLDFW